MIVIYVMFILFIFVGLFILYNLIKFCFFRRNYIPVLMYHRVNDHVRDQNHRYIEHKGSTLDIDSMKVTTATFIAQMDYLKTHGYTTIKMNEVDQFKFGKKNVAVTLDDGYMDNYEYAYKVLKANNQTAIIYLTTGFIGTEEILPVDRHDPNVLSNKVLTWEQVKEMFSNNIDFGAHTVSHEWLTNLSIEEVQAELAESKKVIEEQLGITVHAFAYPAGMYNEKIVKIVKEVGFKNAVITSRGMDTSLFNKDLYTIERETISRGDGMLVFKLKLWGVHRYIRKQWWYHLLRRVIK